MKKTFNINVAGFPFTIDEDAYTLLNDYINTIEHAFRNVDGSAELINDIESRIAELLLISTDQGVKIISVADVEQVIARVGKPEEFVEDTTLSEETPDGERTIDIETETITPPPYIPNPPKTSKRLYRDPQNAMLGGVCSGLAWYIGWDVTWIRLLLVLVVLCSYLSFALVYIVLWIVIPEARTPLQRMQMMGEQPTMENIGKTVTDSFREDQGEHVNPQPTSAPPVANTVANVFSLLAKVLIICGLIIGIPILIGLAIGLIGTILFLLAWGATMIFGTGMPFQSPEFNDYYVSDIVFWGVLCGIGWILTLGIPLYYLIRKGLGAQPFSKQTRRLTNVIWVAGFILAGISTGMVISYGYKQSEHEDQMVKEIREQRRRESEKNVIESTDETISAINMDADSISSVIDSLQTKAEQMMDQAEKLIEQAEKQAK